MLSIIIIIKLLNQSAIKIKIIFIMFNDIYIYIYMIECSKVFEITSCPDVELIKKI